MSNQTITRAEVTDKIVSEVGLTRQESSDLLDRTLDMIGAALEHEDEVKLSRFGNFVVRSKAAREGRNPKTGEEATIAARRVVTFRPSPMLKAQVDNK
ncbi:MULTISPECIES: integration host factor subunit alpha [Hyphomonas]|jgi:integration host factor subunit alpha|uniref:Integration host factor subunit alpha n=1 Tax=Hyphomonas jannaschiana VP2 TaxID=1280952 RepID=A0A059F8C0_9PROT|nr:MULTISPECIES: integration host factor subunit alpha [Hyphomonas]KCZ86844.1 putative integration host factor subunit alpha [Hyphomonas jannaschiana VP2]MAU66404.1 integration host factor subunit alpha [Hyphomonas sp.]MBM58978.1 integration host factor subunit alpha [Hyphomonas sp.]|tara:strand:+ start:237 stop:530 length:294 start_codon:yes stop_codon:yes gene_type:complete